MYINVKKILLNLFLGWSWVKNSYTNMPIWKSLWKTIYFIKDLFFYSAKNMQGEQILPAKTRCCHIGNLLKYVSKEQLFGIPLVAWSLIDKHSFVETLL